MPSDRPLFGARRPLQAAVLATAVLVGEGRAAAKPTSSSARCIDAGELGQRLRDEGKYLDARRALTTCTSEDCPQLIRQDCAGWLAEIQKTLPSVVVAVRDDAGADIAESRVLVDATVARERNDGRPIDLDPGSHVIAVEAGGTRAERSVVIAAGEKNRLVVLTVARRPGPSSDAPVPAAQATVERRSIVLPLTLSIVSGAALASFVGFGLDGQADRSRLRSSPCATTRTCPGDEVQSIRTRFILADVSLLVGLLSGGAAAWLFLRADQ